MASDKSSEQIIDDIIHQALTHEQVEAAMDASAPKLALIVEKIEKLKETIIVHRMSFESQLQFFRNIRDFFNPDTVTVEEFKDKLPQAYHMVEKVPDQDLFQHPEFIRDKNALVRALFSAISSA